MQRIKQIRLRRALLEPSKRDRGHIAFSDPGRTYGKVFGRLRAPVRIPLAAALSFLLFVPSCAVGQELSQLQQKVGIYIWGQLPSDQEPLIRAARDVQALGATGAVRIAIGPYWDPMPAGDSNSPLYEKIHRHDYWTVINSFSVVMITAYDMASFPTKYRDCPSVEACRDLFSAVHREFFAFAFNLSKLSGTFVISNWEAENDFPEADRWNIYRAYLQARIDGIRAGRELGKKLHYPAKVFSAFEFVIINGFNGRPSGLERIGIKLKGIDFLSYSAWHSMGYEFGPEEWKFKEKEMEASFRFAIWTIREYARQNHISDRLIIGEFGELWDIHPEPARLEALIEACLAGGVEYLFNWTAYDQPGEEDSFGHDVSHYGKFYIDGGLTPQGTAFERVFGGPPSGGGDGQGPARNIEGKPVNVVGH